MPLVKPDPNNPLTKQAVVLDLGDLGRQAERIKQEAQAQAQRILAEAREKAVAEAAAIRKEALDAGKAEGLEQGLQEGRKQGARQALEEALAAYEKLSASWAAGLDELQTVIRAVHEEAADAVLGFALDFAQRLTKRAVQADQQAVLPQLQDALSTVLRPVAVTVRIHPDDHPLLDDAAPQLVQRFEQVEQLNLIDDDTIQRGGCIVSYGKAQIDATIQTQMDRIVKLVMGED